MAAPVVASQTVYESSATSTSHSVAKPSGVAAGDLLVLVVCVRTAPTVTLPDGFTEQVNLPNSGNGERYVLATKTATGSEPASYGLTLSVGRNTVIFLLRMTGADTISPINANDETGYTSFTTSPTSPSVTTTEDDTLVFYGVADGTGDTVWTEDSGFPAGTTLIALRNSDAASNNAQGGLSYKTQASAGSTGTGVWSSASTAAITFTFAIKPAASGGAGVSAKAMQSYKTRRAN
ncbi:MAG: hypothetical protein ACFCUQ_07490 [Kiloniellales bacterium]